MNATRSLLVITATAIVVLTAGSVRADFAFGEPVNLGPVVNSSPYADYGPSIAPDGLTLYFSSQRPGGLGQDDIWVTTRATVSDAWGPPVNLGATVNSSTYDWLPTITADGLTLYFTSDRPDGLGKADIWLTTRPTKESPWGEPVNLGSAINSAGDEFFGCISADGCSLYFSTSAGPCPGNPAYFCGGDIYVTTRPTKDSSWGPPVNLGPMPSRGGSGNWDPSISADGLALFFDSDYVNVSLLPDIWLATRASDDSSWGTPILLGAEINTRNGESRPSISADGRILYFSSNRPDNSGNWDLWQAPIIPIVDFNGDGKVHIQDLLRLIESWGKDDPSVDMGPVPWGDGKVDEKDLEVLMSYWDQEVTDPTLIACWKLDETSGATAADSAGANDGTLVGNLAWQPAGGKIDGALQLTGVGNFVTTKAIRDPSTGPLSVFAWVKGGAPGQVIVSQAGGANWLMAGSPDGALRTDLRSAGRQGEWLTSAVVITDGNWHRVGVSWDGSNRILYVDDIEVAKDTQPNLASSTGGLYIGGGSKLAAGTFWSGLIDDVRIYNRAVRP